VKDRRLVFESTRNVTERKQWEKRQQLLLAELTHRVKNTLTVVQAIAHQTMRHSPTVEEFTQRFDGRLAALATSHGLLVDSEWKGADLAELARQQLDSQIESERLRIKGPAVSLPADLATPFGLVLHELATNAAKYGALSQPQGLIDLSWSVARRNNEQIVSVVWQERGGPPPANRQTPGFGTALIESAIPGSTVNREFRTEGLVCTIVFTIPAANGF
jgi:two-component system CheB/CheR fusion protein